MDAQPLKLVHARIHVSRTKNMRGTVLHLRVMGATPHWQTWIRIPAYGVTLASDNSTLPRMVVTAPYWGLNLEHARAESHGLTFIYTMLSYKAYASPLRHYPLVLFLLPSLFLICYKRYYYF